MTECENATIVSNNMELLQYIISFTRQFKDVQHLRCCCRNWRTDLLNPQHPCISHLFRVIQAPFNPRFDDLSTNCVVSDILVVLELAGAALVSDSVLMLVGSGAPNLEGLDISRCQITDIGISWIAHGCPKLVSLDVSLVPSLTDHGIYLIASNCIALEWVAFRYNPLIGDRATFALSTFCPNLHVLHAGNSGIGPMGVGYLTLSSLTLTELSLTNCGELTDREVENLSTKFLQLEVLDFAYVGNITDLGVQAILSSLHRLRRLDLWDCHRVSETALTALKSAGVSVNHPLCASGHPVGCSI